MRLLGAADETHRGEPIAPFVERAMCRGDDLGMIGQAEVIVRTEVEHIGTSRCRDMGLLMRRNDALGLERARGADVVDLLSQVFLKSAVHDCRLLTEIGT